METVGRRKSVTPLIMDRAYEDDFTRYIAQTLGFAAYYNAFGAYLSGLKKLDVMYVGFVQLALVCMVIR